MSFDLYFLHRRPDESWDDAMERLEESSDEEAVLDETQLTQWTRIKDAVVELVPEARESAGAGSRELSDDTTGIQISWYSGELSLTVPYWHSGEDADRIIAVLRQIAVSVESITGLTAYDPQAGEPFLDAGAVEASGVFDRVAQSFGRDVAREEPRLAAPLWKRLFGRR